MAKLVVDRLSKIFPPANKARGPVVALDNVSLEVDGNVFVSVVGPSGCGKSTFLNIASGVDVPTSGSVSITHEGRQAKLGYVFQDARLLPWRTVIQNMMYVSDETGPEGKEKAMTYLDLVGLRDAADMYPGQLSGGMQQRVGIARAFSVEPDLMLMDEPFSHLDAITARSLRVHLEEIWTKTRKTVIFVTHDVMEAVQLSDRIIVLRPGGVIHDDITVDLPRPRRASDKEFAMKQAEILGRFEEMEAEIPSLATGSDS
jgi:NitT/TauT family transport system ATP-binding protein